MINLLASSQAKRSSDVPGRISTIVHVASLMPNSCSKIPQAATHYPGFRLKSTRRLADGRPANVFFPVFLKSEAVSSARSFVKSAGTAAGIAGCHRIRGGVQTGMPRLEVIRCMHGAAQQLNAHTL
jgi:hypothetical protein